MKSPDYPSKTSRKRSSRHRTLREKYRNYSCNTILMKHHGGYSQSGNNGHHKNKSHGHIQIPAIPAYGFHLVLSLSNPYRLPDFVNIHPRRGNYIQLHSHLCKSYNSLNNHPSHSSDAYRTSDHTLRPFPTTSYLYVNTSDSVSSHHLFYRSQVHGR